MHHLPQKFICSFIFMIFLYQTMSAQDDAFFIKKIYNHSLTQGECYHWLSHLSEEIGARASGSDAYYEAVLYTSEILKEIGAEKVDLQECEVDYWDRGDRTSVTIHPVEGQSWNARCLDLGKSIGTNGIPVRAKIVEVKSLEEVDRLGREGIEGKIVFYNRPLDPTQIRTFFAYGGAVDQRVFGASKASEYGGLGAIVRSMTLSQDTVPHTGTMAYNEGVTPVPGIAISTIDADRLSESTKSGDVEVTLISKSKMLGKRTSHTVIGEIKGSTHPEEIILIGGHLDSWDVGGGAHDDGSGCVHAMQVFQTLVTLGYQPKRTLRCVLFANEESGLAGATEYARVSNEAGEFHLAAIESDAGGFSPRGFSVDGHEDVLQPFAKIISDWIETYLSPYGLMMSTGGSGADITPLKSQKGILIGLRPDSQRYFDFHHTENDRIDAVHPRELQLGAAAMTSLVYLIDQYGLE